MKLRPHPVFPLAAVRDLTVQLRVRDGVRLDLAYRLKGDLSALDLPAPAQPVRTDNLWQKACFELFVTDAAGAGYTEFNFSPSTAWAAYRFSAYREGMQALPVEHAPRIECEIRAQHLDLHVSLAIPPAIATVVPAARRLAISAVLQDHAGAMSYWALAHHAGKPDFHHRDGFAYTLEF
jgi:hypothetical protein